MRQRLPPGAGPSPLAAALVAAALLAVDRAWAQTEAGRFFDVAWVAPAECPTRGWLEAEVARVAGAERLATRRPLSAKALVKKATDGRYSVVVETMQDGWTGTREIDAASCEELASSTALILGMMLQSEGDRGHVIPPDPPPPVRDQAPLADAALRRDTSRRWHLFAGPALGTGVGMLPGVSYAVGAVAGIRFGETRFEASGFYAPPVSGEGPASAEGRFDLVSVGARACPTIPLEPVPLGFCVSIDWQRLTGEGSGDPASFASFRRTANLASFGAGAFVVVRLGGRLALPITIEALVPARRPTFSFSGSGVVHQPSTLSGRAWVALEYAFF